jgi:hypothetical protein
MSWGVLWQPTAKTTAKDMVKNFHGLLLLYHPTRMPGILPAHGPRAFGQAFALGLDGIELVVI